MSCGKARRGHRRRRRYGEGALAARQPPRYFISRRSVLVRRCSLLRRPCVSGRSLARRSWSLRRSWPLRRPSSLRRSMCWLMPPPDQVVMSPRHYLSSAGQTVNRPPVASTNGLRSEKCNKRFVGVVEAPKPSHVTANTRAYWSGKCSANALERRPPTPGQFFCAPRVTVVTEYGRINEQGEFSSWGLRGMTQITEQRMSGERRGDDRRGENDQQDAERRDGNQRRGDANLLVIVGRRTSSERREDDDRRGGGQRRGSNERRDTERRRLR